jgi:osmotically-inducible protein OsmY
LRQRRQQKSFARFIFARRDTLAKQLAWKMLLSGRAGVRCRRKKNQEYQTMKQIRKFSMLVLAAVFATMLGCASTPTQDSTGEFVDDAAITTKVKAEILNEPTLKVLEIKVVTFKGIVQLSGFVRSQADVDRALEVARHVRGVRQVDNDMRLK